MQNLTLMFLNTLRILISNIWYYQMHSRICYWEFLGFILEFTKGILLSITLDYSFLLLVLFRAHLPSVLFLQAYRNCLFPQRAM